MSNHEERRVPRRTLLAGIPAAGAAAVIGPASAANPIEVKFGFFADSSELAAYETLVAAFEAENPGIRIVRTPIESSNVSPNGQQMPASAYPEWLYSSFTSQNPPDIFFINYREVDIYASRGVLEPLDSYLAASDVLFEEEIFTQALEPFRSDAFPVRSLGGLPQNVSSLAVYYNTAMFDAAGIERPVDGWSWETFTDVAERLTTSKEKYERVEVYGLAMEPSIHRYAAAIWGGGGEIFDDPKYPTQVLIDSPEARAGLDWMTNLGPQGVGAVPPRWERLALDDTNRFAKGGAAMLIQSRRVTSFLRDNALMSWDVAPLPVGAVEANVLHSDGIGMWSASPNKEAAWTFIEFVIGPKGQSILAESGRTVPSLRTLAESDSFLKGSSLGSTLGIKRPPANAQVFLRNIGIVRPLPASNVWTSAIWLFESAFKGAFYDNGDVEAAVSMVVDGAALTLREPDDLIRKVYPSRPLETED
ncbi:MAG: sugar ABC transporter substrate-binding protein [Thermomicrobiales bacterium]|nr:sugar ABC transporter substrate-binding protein [Thermomicrobiales bacterium]